MSNGSDEQIAAKALLISLLFLISSGLLVTWVLGEYWQWVAIIPASIVLFKMFSPKSR